MRDRLALTILLLQVLCCATTGTSADSSATTKPYCAPENLRLEQISGQTASWYLQYDGTFRLDIHHCKLRHFSGADAKKCLANNHILFMGDSLSRYFYMSLAVLMATNKWAPKFSRSTDAKFPPSMLSEGDFGSWADFHHYTNSILNEPSTSSHEMCDCFRDDTVTWFGPNKDLSPCSSDAQKNHGWCHQQESTNENRHFRSYLYDDPTSEPGAFGEGGGNSSTMARLSYIQFYGRMPMRGRKGLSVRLPHSERDYLSYVQKVGDQICPLSLVNDPKIPPPVLNQKIYGHLNLTRRAATDWATKYAPPLPRWPVTNSLVPMRQQCGFTLRENRDDTKTAAFLNVPQFFDTTETDYEREVIVPMGVTHSIINIGYHSSLPDSTAETGANWLTARLDAASGRTKGSGLGFVDAPAGSRLPMAKVTWRSSTAYAFWAEHNEEEIRTYRAKQTFTKEPRRVLGYFDVYDLTAQLYELHNWAVAFGGELNAEMLVLLGSNKEIDVERFNMVGMNETEVVHLHKAMQALSKLRVKVGDRLLSHIAADGATATTGQHAWSGIRPGARAMRGGERTHGHVHSRSHRRGGRVLIDLPPVMVDDAHPQPWVYTQLNTAFLNSICPL